MYLHEIQKHVEKRAFIKLFCPVSQRVKIIILFSDNIWRLSNIVKKLNTTAKLATKSRNNYRILIVLMVSSMTHTRILIQFLTVARPASGTRKANPQSRTYTQQIFVQSMQLNWSNKTSAGYKVILTSVYLIPLLHNTITFNVECIQKLQFSFNSGCQFFLL